MRGSCNGRLNVRHNDAAVVVVLARCRCSSAEVKMVGEVNFFSANQNRACRRDIRHYKPWAARLQNCISKYMYM